MFTFYTVLVTVFIICVCALFYVIFVWNPKSIKERDFAYRNGLYEGQKRQKLQSDIEKKKLIECAVKWVKENGDKYLDTTPEGKFKFKGIIEINLRQALSKY